MIANRMKPFLDSIISPTQSAFVPKRLITDNVLVAFEVNHFLKCRPKGGKQFMAIKLDIRKAYDRIEWSFLKRILLKLGFADSFVSLIMLCVSSVSYSFLLNGKEFGALQLKRGLRQGDPLSPYISIYCVEGFIRLMDAAVSARSLHGVKVAPSAPPISNLCFADDTVIFCEANTREALEVLRILERYVAASGQIINLEKSTMMFSRGTHPSIRNEIQQLMGIQVVDKFEKYLSMLAVVDRSKKEIFGFLKDRIWERISRWSDRDFSLAGREVLIKAVLQAIPTYVMSCFLLPSTLLDEIEAMIRKFWWSGGSDKRVHWLSWSALCRAKKCGGLGFRDLECFNLAMLAKQAWRLLTSPSSLLARILKARYFPRESFYSAEVGVRPSFAWRSIHRARACLLPGLRMCVGNGLDTSIWADAWLPPPSTGRIITTRPQNLTFPECVGDLIDWSSWTWNCELIRSVFWAVDVHQIIQVPIGAPSSKDTLMWAFSKSGAFTVRSCYHNLLSGRLNEDEEATSLHITADRIWDWIWGLKVPPKVRTFVWRGCQDILPTRVVLMQRHLGTDPYCCFCDKYIETQCHVFFHCNFFLNVWDEAGFSNLVGPEIVNFAAGIRQFCAKLDDADFGLVCVLLWNIWNYRNDKIHGSERSDRESLVSQSRNFLESFRSARINFPVKQTVTASACWSPLPMPFVKVNFDVALLNFGHYQIAGVAHCPAGKGLRWRVQRIQGSPSPIIAEAGAARLAVLLAQEMYWPHVVLEGDCLQVINAFKALPERGYRPFDVIVYSCYVFLLNFTVFRVSFIKRSGNTLAHALAHISFQDSDVIEGFVPPANLAY